MSEGISLLLLAVATNLDNLAVGAAYALRRRRIGWGVNLLIAAANAGATAAAALAGAALGRFLPPGAGDSASSFLLLGLGLWTWWDTWRSRPRPLGTPAAATTVHVFHPAIPEGTPPLPALSGRVGWREGAALAFGLSVSNLLAGVAAGLDQRPLGPLVFAMAVASVAGIVVGAAAGHRLGTWLPVRWAGVAAGALLVSLAVLGWAG